MSTFFEELKRRNVFRVAIVYIVVGSVVMQVADFLAPLLRLPEWTVSMALYIGIVGFPFALVFAWAFELTPEGLKRSSDVLPDESIAHETGAKLNRLVIGLMALAIVGLLVDRYFSSHPVPSSAQTESNTQAQAPPALDNETGRAKADSGLAKSIAVLPFVNMSNDPEQEYFSDGISEELLNALAKISALRVAARTSSFSFKGQNADITDIGNQLKVETVLEGSVRKSGKRLRITAQLINVNDGYHLWSESYDRDITDIFVIQDEISAAIVKALRVHLAGGEELAQSNVVDVDAYNLYLLARHNVRRRTESSLQLAATQFQQAIDIDPTYAAAWAGKALATTLLSDDAYGKIPKGLALQQAQEMLDRAFSLDPQLGVGHAVQGLKLQLEYRPEESLASLQRAIEANPSEGILYHWRAISLGEIGQSARAFEAMKTAYRIDPLHPSIQANLAWNYVWRRDDEAARAIVTQGSPFAYELEAEIASRDGHYAESVRYYKQAIQMAGHDSNSRPQLSLNRLEFFQLASTDLPGWDTPDQLTPLYQSILDPETALPRLRQMAETSGGNLPLTALLLALINLERCGEALVALEPKAFDQRALQGDMGNITSDIWLAYMQAFCQQQVGREQEALALAGRIQSFIESAVANGEPPYYYPLLAAVQLLLGEDDAAIQSLTSAWDNYGLFWHDFSAPRYQKLSQRAEFLALKKAVQSHLNTERAKLGWDPVAIQSSTGTSH